jgi:adenine-specific DNA-methyltransferase
MDGKSQNILLDQLAKLKEAFPEAVSEHGITWERLRLTLGDDIALTGERYHLNWAGKSDAFRAIQTPTTATLKPQREQSIDFDTTQNIFIEGENLEVLKVLRRVPLAQSKM